MQQNKFVPQIYTVVLIKAKVYSVNNPGRVHKHSGHSFIKVLQGDKPKGGVTAVHSGEQQLEMPQV